MITKRWKRMQVRCMVSALGLAILILVEQPARAALPEGRSVDLETQGTGVSLSWLSITNAPYEVQTRSNLVQGSWGVLDTIVNAGGVTVYPVTPDDSPSRFFRVLFPQPVVTAGEPARTTTGTGGSYLYITGEFFYAGDQVRVGGLLASNAVFLSPSLLRVELPPGLTPGRYDVELFSGRDGAVLAALHDAVTVVDLAADPSGLLYGPPEDPPARPSAKAGLLRETISCKYETIKYARMAGRGNTTAGDICATFTLTPYSFSSAGGGGAFDDTDEDGGSAFKSGGFHEMRKSIIQNIRARVAASRGGSHPIRIMYPNISSAATKSAQVSRSNISNNRMAGGCVLPHSGEVQVCDVDLAIPGRGLDFVWARTYRSRTMHAMATMGSHCTCSYDVHCVQNSSGGMDVYDGTGRKDTFTPGTNGVYSCPEFFREGTLSNSTFTLTFADTGRWVFNSFNGTAAAGKLHQIITRNGDTMTLGYDTSGRLTQIVDDLDRTNTVAYNKAGQLTSVTDFSGRTVTYQYYNGSQNDPGGSPGDLKSVTSPPVTGTPNGNDFPGGKTTTYTYSNGYTDDRENHLLLSVVDAEGQTTSRFVYQHSPTDPEYLRCLSMQGWTNTPATFSYLPQTASPDNHFETQRCVMNDPQGNVTEAFYDARNRCVMAREFTGRATPGLAVTDTVNRPTGKLRSSDPDSYETQWTWNNDSLRIYEKEPAKLEIPNLRFVYQSDLDPATPPRKRADCREVRELASSPVDLDGDGAPDVTERVWHYTYDPRFGSDPTPSFGKKLYVGNLPYSARNSSPNKTIATGLTDAAGSVVAPGGDDMPGGAVYHAINTKGTGTTGRMAGGPPQGGSNPLGEIYKIDGRVTHLDTKINSLTGRIVPTVSAHAVNTKGTGLSGRMAGGPAPTRHLEDIDESRADLFIDTCNDWVLPYIELRVMFPTQHTDARGNVTTIEYDLHGNAKSHIRKSGAVIAADYNCKYTAQGQLTAVTNAPDADGYRRVDTLSYYTSGPQAGYLQSIATDEQGEHLTSAFEYDARGNVTRYIDPGTNDWLFTYNSLDQCVRRTTPNNSFGSMVRSATDYAYDANDNLVQTAAELRDAADNLTGGQTNRFRYDGLGRLTETALAVDASHALTNRFVYDGNNQCVQALGGDAVSGADPHQTVAYQYDERGLLFREIAAPGASLAATNEFDYEPSCQIKRFKAEMYVEQIAYDGFDRPSSLTDPMGNQTACFFDANDNLTVVRQFGELNDVAGSAGNVRLAEARYDYDDLDRCVNTHEPFFDPATQSPLGGGEALTTFAYAPNNACVSATDALGHMTSYGYDTAGRLSSVTSPGGAVVYSCTRNAAGRPSALFQTFLANADLDGPPRVFSVTNGYDALNRLVSTTDSAGNTSRYAYDSLGRVVRVTDPNGNDTTFAYNYTDQILGCVAYAGSSSVPSPIVLRGSSAAYDLCLRCVASTDANGNTTGYAYDSLGRCATVTQTDGTHQTFAWNSHSDLASEQDANGTVVVHTYDLNDRCISNSIMTGAGVAPTTTFETFAYDGCDRLTGNRDDDCDGAFAYNSLGSRVSETLNGLATTSTYDALGNRLSLAYPGGRTLTYAYDALNRCASIADSGQQLLASYAYDGPDHVSLITCGNGTRTQIRYDGLAGITNASGDHGFGQVSRVRHGTVGAPSSISDISSTYSQSQAKLTKADSQRALDATLTYDALDRLVSSRVATNGALARLTTYGLDRVGNRTNVTGAASWSGDYTMSPAIPPADYQMNQYTTTPFDARTYDDEGNLASRGSSAGPVTYQYDYAGRLVQVEALDSGTGTLAPLASYCYDALGRRVSKTLYSGGTATTTQFLYDGDSVVEERSGTTTTATYVLPHCFGAGQPHPQSCLSMRLGTQNYYVHTDDQGNALALTGAKGEVVERYDYDDYGAVSFLRADGTPLVNSDGMPATSSAVGNPYCWGGQRLDAETGLQNDDGSGYLDTASGRGLNRDGHLWCWGEHRSGIIGNDPSSGDNPLVNRIIPYSPFNKVKDHSYVGHVTLLK